MKAFAIIRMLGGQPDIDITQYPYHGFVLCWQLGQWGAYLISGTGAQLQAINSLPHVYGIVAVTQSGDVIWPELDNEIPNAVRNRINTWIENNHPAWPMIPEGWTYRQAVIAIYRRFNDRFDLAQFWVRGPEDV